MVSHGEECQRNLTAAHEVRARVRLRQPDGKVVVLARNDPLRAGLRCRRPAQWKSVPEYDDETRCTRTKE